MFYEVLFLALIFDAGKPADITDESIKNVTNEIWNSDANRFTSKDLIYNSKGEKFFEYVNEDKLVGTYKLLINLFDNYEARVGNEEKVDAVEIDEEDKFLEEVLNSAPMKIAHNWLVQQNLAHPDKKVFKREISQYWLQLYSRANNILDSSGFEHVFLGEIKKGDTIGFHNWVFFYLNEKNGQLKYGTTKKDCHNDILAFSFTWRGYPKPISSIMLGASPEAELAIFTVCFLARAKNPCRIQLSQKNYNVETYKMSGKKMVSTSYVVCS